MPAIGHDGPEHHDHDGNRDHDLKPWTLEH